MPFCYWPIFRYPRKQSQKSLRESTQPSLPFVSKKENFTNVPSSTRRVASASLMTIFSSPFAFRASMTRWAPPSLEKRTWPYSINIKSTHVIYNTSSNDKLGARLKRRPEWWEGPHKDEAKEIPTVTEISFYFKRKKERVRLHERKAKGMTSLRECKK